MSQESPCTFRVTPHWKQESEISQFTKATAHSKAQKKQQNTGGGPKSARGSTAVDACRELPGEVAQQACMEVLRTLSRRRGTPHEPVNADTAPDSNSTTVVERSGAIAFSPNSNNAIVAQRPFRFGYAPKGSAKSSSALLGQTEYHATAKPVPAHATSEEDGSSTDYRAQMASHYGGSMRRVTEFASASPERRSTERSSAPRCSDRSTVQSELFEHSLPPFRHEVVSECSAPSDRSDRELAANRDELFRSLVLSLATLRGQVETLQEEKAALVSWQERTTEQLAALEAKVAAIDEARTPALSQRAAKVALKPQRV